MLLTNQFIIVTLGFIIAIGFSFWLGCKIDKFIDKI